MAGKKKIFFFLVAVIPHIFFAASFSGLAGIKGDFSSKSDTSGFNPQLNLSAFFSGQLDITSNFLVRSELSIQTSDVIETKLFSEKNAGEAIREQLTSILFCRTESVIFCKTVLEKIEILPDGHAELSLHHLPQKWYFQI